MVSRKKKVKAASEDANALPLVPSSHRVFASQEILGEILHIFAYDRAEEVKERFKRSPNRWKTELLPLLVINRAFYDCVTTALWNKLDSLVPLTRLLPSVTQFSHPALLSPKEDVDIWARFKVYSSKTVSLGLKGPRDDEGAWLSFLFSQPSCPKSLFPRLQNLTIHQADVITCTILPAVAHQLKHCDLKDNSSNSPCRYTLATLSVRSPGLSSLKLHSHPTKSVMQCLGTLGGLQRLTIDSQWSQPLVEKFEAISQLSLVRGLRALFLSYPTSSSEHGPPEGYAADVKECLDAEPHLPNLERLVVVGDGLTQHMIARGAALPNTLQHLDLVCLPPDSGRELFIPLLLQVYLERNKGLETFRVKWESARNTDAACRHKDMEPLLVQTDPVYQTSCAQFLLALSQASSLTELRIDGIPFLDDDIGSKICEFIPNFPNLRRLTLRPLTTAPHWIGAYSSKKPPKPVPITFLEPIARACTTLEWIDMPVTWGTPLPLPDRHPAPHSITRMWLAGSDNGHPRSLQGCIAVGRYLNRVFPNLNCLSEIPEGYGKKGKYADWEVKPDWLSAMERGSDSERVKYGNGEAAFWKEIEVLIHSYHDERTHAVLDSSSKASSS
ncbi:hypothetical protein D9611_011231 [Ephemerocybe angulata]|uniref:Uncharacterized protein n=1 Tax=Ephemerocybe angulata TaxID=980116 RepID=A0A8H5FJY8_9AGAR|nr:hypothetical protein D9611_011231 [Tulosesus angulatus]